MLQFGDLGFLGPTSGGPGAGQCGPPCWPAGLCRRQCCCCLGPEGAAATTPETSARPVRGQCLSGRGVVASQPANCGGRPGSAVSCSPRLNWDWCEHVLPCTPPSPAGHCCTTSGGRWGHVPFCASDRSVLEHRASGRYLLPIPSVWTSGEGSPVVVPVGRESVCIYFVAPSGEAAAVADCRPPDEGPRISSCVTCMCSQPNEQAQASTVLAAAVMASTRRREHLAM